MDARGRRWIFVAALVILVTVGVVTLAWDLTARGSCGDSCSPFTLAEALTDLAWVIAAIIALGLLAVLTRRERRPEPGPRAAAPNVLGRGRPAVTGDGPKERLERFLTVLERTASDDLVVLAVRPLDPTAHDRARSDALDAARAVGRAALVVDAGRRIADWLDRAWARQYYDPSFLGVTWRHEALRPEDRVLVAATLQDGALACIVQDRVDEAIADELLGPCAPLVEGPDPADDGERGAGPRAVGG